MGTVCRISFYANIIILWVREEVFGYFFIVEKGKHYELLNYKIKWFNASRVNVSFYLESKTKEICFTSSCAICQTQNCP